MSSAEEFYKENVERALKQSSDLENKVTVIGWSRLGVVLLGALFDYYLYKQNKINLIFIITIFFIGIFLILAYYHNTMLENKKRLKLLRDINEKGLKRLSGEFKNFADNGEEYLDDEHSFINDLDVFGNNSIFQCINTTSTKGGREISTIIEEREVIK